MKDSKVFISSLVYFILSCVLVIFYIVLGYVDISSFGEMGVDIFTTLIIQVVILFVLPIVLYTVFRKKPLSRTFQDFNYSKVSFKVIFSSFGLGICCYFLNIIIASFFSNIIGLFGYEGVPTYATYTAKTTDVEFVVSFILVAVLPAICEETVHRGLLLGGFSRLGLKRAVLLSSLCFGLLHLNINQFFYATVIGFLMAIAVIITKSIIPAMIMHFCNNGLSCYLAFAGERQLFGSKIMDNFSTFISGSNAFTAFLGSFAIMAILVILIALFYIVLLRETRTKKMKTLLKQVSKIEQSKQLREKVAYINPNVNPFSNTYMNNLEQINSLLIQYNITSEKELIFKKEEKTYHKPTIMERVFVISSIFLLSLVTIFTFVWGIL